MLYWSMLVYKCGREGGQCGVTLEGAMRLYGLQQSELVGGLTLPSPELLHLRVCTCLCLHVYIFSQHIDCFALCIIEIYLLVSMDGAESHCPRDNALDLCLQLHEKSLDTKTLLAWSDDTVVLSFRGTASLKNVFAGVPL